MKGVLFSLIVIPLFTIGQKTFQYSDKEFEIGSIHITPPISFNTCFRLGHGVENTVIDSLVTFLKNNPNLSIEVGNHTDYRGSADYNLKLSQRRAESVVKKLINSGIDSTRITFKGYGETQPIISEEKIKELAYNDSKSQEEVEKLHAINRRNEIKITKIE